jgi:hypothetical protein
VPLTPSLSQLIAGVGISQTMARFLLHGHLITPPQVASRAVLPPFFCSKPRSISKQPYNPLINSRLIFCKTFPGRDNPAGIRTGATRRYAPQSRIERTIDEQLPVYSTEICNRSSSAVIIGQFSAGICVQIACS